MKKKLLIITVILVMFYPSLFSESSEASAKKITMTEMKTLSKKGKLPNSNGKIGMTFKKLKKQNPEGTINEISPLISYQASDFLYPTVYYLNVDSISRLKGSTKVVAIKKTYFTADFTILPTKKVMNKYFPKKEVVTEPGLLDGLPGSKRNIHETGKYYITNKVYEVEFFPDVMILSVGTNKGIIASLYDLTY
ncbi:hypothetical protein ACFSY7_11610 [Kurthia populi]|uniref:DUF4309 domain-containing protein n=1 Tax=Kurthia populi TaxID=1562132 RepID=A0ABW5Y1I7_9BACL